MRGFKQFPNLFIHQINDKHVAIFHPFQFCIFYLSIEEYELLINKEWSSLRDKGLLNALLENKIVYRKPFHYDNFLKNIRESYFRTKKPFVSVAYFILSNYCNISCAYCFLKIKNGISSPRALMPIQTGIDAVCFWLEGLPREMDRTSLLRVIFYGGEPLLNFHTLEAVVSFLRMLELKGRFGKAKLVINLNTNGTLITKEIARFLARQGVHVIISLDGYSYTHNQTRFRKNAKGFFGRVIKSCQLIKQAGGRFDISTTIGSFNVDYLPEIAHNFARKMKTAVGFNLMRDSYFKNNPCQIAMEKVGKVIFDCYEIFRKYGIYEDRVGRYVKAIHNKKMQNYCAAYGDQLVFLPGGDILPCHAFFPIKKYNLGNIYRDDIHSVIKNNFFKKWYSRNTLDIPKCKYCPAMLFCGGGCVQEVVTKGHSFRDIDKNLCLYFKIFLEWYVKDIYKEAIKQKNSKNKDYAWITKRSIAFDR